MTKELNRAENEKESQRLGLSICKQYNYTIEHMIELQETLPCQEEGFVVLFSNNLRVKIKGKEYLKMSKIINSVNPLAVWAILENGKVPEHYYVQLPEEILPDAQAMGKELERRYKSAKDEIYAQFQHLTFPKDDYRTIGIFMKEHPEFFPYSGAVFAILRGKDSNVDRLILDMIRPKNNVL